MRIGLSAAAAVAFAVTIAVQTAVAPAANAAIALPLDRTASAKVPSAPPVQFLRANFMTGTGEGIAGTGPLTLGTPLETGTYDDPFDAPDRGPLAYERGTWTSVPTSVPFPFDELVASWNATTPAGTWISIEMEATTSSGRPTKFYTMGIWASGDGDIHRTSVPAQGDADGSIAIDTFVRAKKAPDLSSYRLRVRLYRLAGTTATPSVRMLGAMTSQAFKFTTPSPYDGGTSDVAVRRYSQEVHTGEYPQFDGGGEAWCSPTSTAMVLDRWGATLDPAELAAIPYADPAVDHAARFVYDWNYQGAGNWPDNAAYAARYVDEAFVTRLRSLREAELFIKAGIPLVASINGRLPGFFFGKTNGHLLVIRGFTASGDVIANDPAVPTNAEVTKTYGRKDFEDVWLGGSAGIVYVVHPSRAPLPANVSGPPNW